MVLYVSILLEIATECEEIRGLMSKAPMHSVVQLLLSHKVNLHRSTLDILLETSGSVFNSSLWWHTLL